MHATRLLPVLALALGSVFSPLRANEAASLHDRHCAGCHDTGVYTRPERKMTSRAGLYRQVQRCELALGLQWFDDEIAAMTDYLDEHFYRFAP